MNLNPISREQLIAYIRQLDEDYRRNRTAAETLLRSLPDAAGIMRPSEPPRDDTTIGIIENIVSSQPEVTWTAPQVKAKLAELKPGHTIPDKTISNCLAKLHGRQKLDLVQRGTGSVPHVYKWKGGAVVGFPAPGTLWK